MQEEPLTVIDQLGTIEEWLQSIKGTLATESISYGELAQVDSVYESVKVFEAE